MNDIKVCYIWDSELIKQCDRLPAVSGRASLVHKLISAYGLINRLKVVRSSSASYNEMRKFHSELYLDHLKSFVDIDEEDYTSTRLDEEYGIGYDCQPVSNMFHLVSTIAGGSLTAARCLILGIAEIAINWCGGWHHAHRFGAEGFCYVNDIVIAIENLRKKFSKVLYIDLDVHHGNGVQDAYSISSSVFTLSIHKLEPGFYPGTGDLDSIGSSFGKGYSCNVPLHEFYSDDTLEYVFGKVFNCVYSYFEPDCIVVQCGADALAHDPQGGANLTIKGYSKCVRLVLDKRKPCLLLGGGGYKHENTSRLWTALTALTVGITLDEHIPDHEEWLSYGPDYSINVEPSLAKDANKINYLDECFQKIQDNLRKHLNTKEILVEPSTKKNKIETVSACSVDKELSTSHHTKHVISSNSYKTLPSQKESKECDKDISDVYEFVD